MRCSFVLLAAISVVAGDPAKPDAPKSCYVTVEWAAGG
jgi:hypothetical protein